VFRAVKQADAAYAQAHWTEANQAALVREPGWGKAYYNLSTVYLLQAQAILESSRAGEGGSTASDPGPAGGAGGGVVRWLGWPGR